MPLTAHLADFEAARCLPPPRPFLTPQELVISAGSVLRNFRALLTGATPPLYPGGCARGHREWHLRDLGPGGTKRER